MEINVCKFLKVGLHSPCKNKTTKNSCYCNLHNYRLKTSKVLPCIKCKRGTCSKYQICNLCGAGSIRKMQDYWKFKSYNAECLKFRKIEI